MKSKTLKRTALWLAIVVAILAVGRLVLDNVAGRQLRTALADLPGGQISFQRLHVSPLAGSLEIRDVEIALQDSAKGIPDIRGSIEALQLEGLRWSALSHGEACAKRLIIRKPQARVVLPSPSEEKKDTAAAAAPARKPFFQKVSLSEIRMEKGSVGLSSTANPMKVSAKGIEASVYNIGVLLTENRVEYNDSIYRFALDSLDFLDESGISRIQIGHLATADAGPVAAQALHIYCDVPQEAVAEMSGKVSAMWYDVKLDSLYTSPLHLPRLASSGHIDIGRVHLSGPEIVLLQDDRYPPKVPYTTLQEGLNTLEMPLHIGQIDAHIQSFTFLWETTHVNRGTFRMENLRLALQSVSNAPDNVMEMGVQAGHPDKSRLDLSLSIKNDKQESTHGRMRIRNLEGVRLDPFLRPLYGATVKADIHLADCRLNGNKHKMTNDFCMLYDNLSLKAWDDAHAPFRIVAKNSGFINFVANIIAPHSNPSAPGKEPKKVEVTVERDPMQPYPSYIIQNLTMGMLRTVLPGGSVQKRNK